MNKHITRLENIRYAIESKTKDAIEEIHEFLRKIGSISNIADDELIFAAYLDEQDYGVSSPYNSVELYLNKEIIVTLRDEHTICEDDLTTQNVLDIIQIIENHYGTYKN